MQPNATELKVSPLLPTPTRPTRARPAHRVRVDGVPNETTVASFPASTVGVNEANQGQMGPGINPPSVAPLRRREPRIPAPCPRHSSEGWNPGEDGGEAPRPHLREE